MSGEGSTDLLSDWRKYERSLLNKVARRDQDYLELHDDYIWLEVRCNALMAVIRRQAKRDRFERAQMEAKEI